MWAKLGVACGMPSCGMWHVACGPHSVWRVACVMPAYGMWHVACGMCPPCGMSVCGMWHVACPAHGMHVWHVHVVRRVQGLPLLVTSDGSME